MWRAFFAHESGPCGPPSNPLFPPLPNSLTRGFHGRPWLIVPLSPFPFPSFQFGVPCPLSSCFPASVLSAPAPRGGWRFEGGYFFFCQPSRVSPIFFFLGYLNQLACPAVHIPLVYGVGEGEKPLALASLLNFRIRPFPNCSMGGGNRLAWCFWCMLGSVCLS